MDRLVLALDGGQTSTLAVIADTSGHLLAAGLGGPCNHFVEPGGPERFRRALEESIGRAWEALGARPGRLAMACFGCPTGGPEGRRIIDELVDAEAFAFVGDQVTAHLAAHAGRPGVVVIAGGGSVAYGEDGRGGALSLGGWGYLMGDEGSGYDIARRALSAATRGADGRGPQTVLSRTIPRFLGYPDLRALHRGLYSLAVTRDRLASLATPVGRAARRGDRVAQEILAAAAASLAEAAAAVARQLGLVRPRVSIVGGVAQCGRWLWVPFTAALQAQVPGARVLRPRFQPAVGAVLAAYRALGLSWEAATLARLRATQKLLCGLKYA